ncbi:unnamed protein product [Adineta steineri]|uniref:Uncharacterized protein n=1 Tax=Adineta steineri TaxID=433720 RepID=A0A819TEL9_9BILA|nr:unnamed protein product [Adineta steineri]
MITAFVLFQHLIERCKSAMKVPGTSLVDATTQSSIINEEIQVQWEKTCDFYRNERQCDDYVRIENEIYECFDALVNDAREIMIGIDSKSSLKHIAIPSMRIYALTLRTLSYAVAGVDLLNRLIQLQEKFKPSQTIPGNIPTKILNNFPVLTFFSAWTAAVRVNNLDANIGKENARKMLSYIKKYIDNYHSNLSQYIRYEMDHENTYEDTLLNYIIAHYVHNYTDEQTKQQLTAQAIRRGSNEDGSIRYTSMHLIIFKDIIDKKSLHPLFHLLDENEKNESTCLYDCIITIGGSVEKRFNKVRYLVRPTFMNDPQLNKEQYHFPLSIRLLSRAGQTPRNHAKDIKTCQCLTENKTAIEQICEHYQLSNDAECLILTCILKELEIKNHIHFNERNTTNRRRSNSICTNRETTDTIIHKLDDVLSQRLIEFIQNQIL